VQRPPQSPISGGATKVNSQTKRLACSWNVWIMGWLIREPGLERFSTQVFNGQAPEADGQWNKTQDGLLFTRRRPLPAAASPPRLGCGCAPLAGGGRASGLSSRNVVNSCHRICYKYQSEETRQIARAAAARRIRREAPAGARPRKRQKAQRNVRCEPLFGNAPRNAEAGFFAVFSGVFPHVRVAISC
jgi:hypothetical protein